jgi:hypothetical protein
MLAAGQTHVLVEPIVSEVTTVEYSAALCPGASALLDAGEWYAVEWEGGSTEWQLEVFSEGIVTATAWNEQGEQFALQYEVQLLQTTDAAWQVLPSLCGGDNAALQASDAVLNLWVNAAPYTTGDAVLPSGAVSSAGANGAIPYVILCSFHCRRADCRSMSVNSRPSDSFSL